MTHRSLFFALILGALPLTSAPLWADTRVPADAGEMQLSFAPVVRAAAPAVVNIYAQRLVSQRVSPFADDPFFSQFFDFGEAQPRVQNSLGSGVILREDGIVVSNFHVVGDADAIRVVLADKREFDGHVILSDAGADLAVIRLDGAKGLPALRLTDSDAAEVGDLVLAIGNPFGVGQTVTSGIVSGLARSGGNLGRGQGYFIQTDAAINPGNSGGALVDMQGRLLGINTSILTRSGGSNGIGFAIPANLVAQYVAQAEAGKSRLERPWSGVEVQPVDAGIAEAMGLPSPRGVVISRLHPDSPFAQAGLTTGDVITSVGGLPVDGPQELEFRLTTLGIGATDDVQYWRNGREAVVQVRLDPPPGGTATPVPMPSGTIFEGISVADLTPALIADMGLPLSARGVVVVEVTGPAVRTQLAPGDMLTAINGQPVETADRAAALAASGGRDWQIEFDRGGQHAQIRLRGR
jgi:Do/DeqQ family serine protease